MSNSGFHPHGLPAAPVSSVVRWLICVIAAIGFTFDTYELLMLPLIAGPAIGELTGATPGSPEFQMWVGRLFYIPALAGGVFGLLGGYLTDVFGRRRVLTWSILLYAFSAFACGFVTSMTALLFLRCLTFIGVCVEFVAAVAWLAELFPDRDQRERVLGYTQAFSSVGGLLVAFVYGLVVQYGDSLPPITLPESWVGAFGVIKDSSAPWRYTLMSGLIPAIPLILIRPFLPESPQWQEKKVAGTLRRPSVRELFQPALCRTTVVSTLMVACSFGAAFGAIQHIQRIVPGLPEVKSEVARSTEDIPAEEATKIKRRVEQRVAAQVTTVQEIGGLSGRVLFALLVVRMVSRRSLIRFFQIPGLFLMPFVFAWAAIHDLNLLYVGIFLIGLVTVAQFSFWGNYLPEAYPVHLRGTGESFAANIGGRMIGTSFAWLTSMLAALPQTPGGSPTEKLAYTAAGVGFAVFAIGLLASFFLPQPNTPE